MDMPKPAPEQLRLHALAGTWSGQERMHPSPWDPHGGAADGVAVNRVALDGFAVVQDYVQKRGGQVSFSGVAVMTWDAAAQEYQMHWWDSMGGPVNVFRGQWTGEALSLKCEGPQGVNRCTYQLADLRAGRYSFRMEVSPDGKQWFPFMEGEYRRA